MRPGPSAGSGVPPDHTGHPRTFPGTPPEPRAAPPPALPLPAAAQPPASQPPTAPRRPAVAVLLLAGLATAAVVVLADRPDPPARRAPAALPTVPGFSIGPVFPPTPDRPPAPTATRTSPQSSRRVTVAATTSPPAVAPQPALVPGAVIGLEPAGRPGFRVRHRDFAGRVDRIGPRSGPLDRLDSRFVVRAGLTGDGCVAFESVNYPGRYLRHQNFVVRLHPPDRTALFAADATFCEVPRGRGRIALRSVNYPDRFVAAAPDDVLRLLPAGGEVPAFRVRPPL